MPHLLKANPHKSTFANMMLFLRYQVEEFAWKKWGSPEALDAEWERRAAEKKKKRNKKFVEGLKELRKRTRETVWQRRKDEEHKHVFGEVERGNVTRLAHGQPGVIPGGTTIKPAWIKSSAVSKRLEVGPSRLPFEAAIASSSLR